MLCPVFLIMPDLIRHSAPSQAKDIKNSSKEGKHIAGVQVTIKQEPEVSPSLHTAKPVSTALHPLRCQEIPETTSFTSAKLTTECSRALRWPEILVVAELTNDNVHTSDRESVG